MEKRKKGITPCILKTVSTHIEFVYWTSWFETLKAKLCLLMRLWYQLRQVPKLVFHEEPQRKELMPWVVWFSVCLCFHDHMFYLPSRACLTWHVDSHLGLRYKWTHVWAFRIAYTLHPVTQWYMKADCGWAGLGCLTFSHPVS